MAPKSGTGRCRQMCLSPVFDDSYTRLTLFGSLELDRNWTRTGTGPDPRILPESFPNPPRIFPEPCQNHENHSSIHLESRIKDTGSWIQGPEPRILDPGSKILDPSTKTCTPEVYEIWRWSRLQNSHSKPIGDKSDEQSGIMTTS